MIRNPYALASSPSKRPRPWEGRRPADAVAAKQRPNDAAAGHRPPALRRPSPVAAATSSIEPGREIFRSEEASVAREKVIPKEFTDRSDETDPFDCGIDYSAIPLLNQNLSERAQARPSPNVAPSRSSVLSSWNGTADLPNAASRTNVAKKDLTSGTLVRASAGGCGVTDPPLAAPKPPTVPSSSAAAAHPLNSASIHSSCALSSTGASGPVPRTGAATRPSTAHQIASLRPPTWQHPTKKPPASPSSQSVAGSASPVTDQRQASLPRCMQFDEQAVKPIQDEFRQSLVKNANLSVPLLNGWTLYSHQKKAILRGLLMRRMILALDMGLGKTLIGCVWSKAFQKTFPGCKVIVICPVSLKKEWRRTAEEATGLKVQEDDTKGKNAPDATSDVFIASWAKIPTNVSTKRFVVVCDEAHSMQSMQAARTKETLKLAGSSQCCGVLLLTGTPMKNGKPSNLFPLLRAVGHPFGNHQRPYEKHFCGGREARFNRGRGGTVWMANGASNLEQLRELVSSHVLHLTKEACLKDLPPQKRVFQHVPVSSRLQLKHNQAMQNLVGVYAASSSMENGNDAILGAFQKVRFVGSLAKVDATVKLAKKVLQSEPAIVIFTGFVEAAKAVHRQLAEGGWEGELLTGETPARKRQDMVDNFQNGLSPVFVCTFGAGGVGLTLTAACTVILLDRPWTPGDAQQAEDRVRRIGQTKPVRSIWMSAFELDRQVDDIIEQKKQTAEAVLADGGGANGSSIGPKLSIFHFLKSILPAQDATGLKQTSILQFSQDPAD